MSNHERALAAVLQRHGRTLTRFEREQVLYLVHTLAVSGPTVLQNDVWDPDLLLVALQAAGYVIVTESSDYDETTLYVMACGPAGTWLITQTYQDDQPFAQVQHLAAENSWLQVLLRLLYTDLPAILSTELDWGAGEGPVTLWDMAAALITQNEADPQPEIRTANRQATRIVRALAALIDGQDPAAYLVTDQEVAEAAEYAALVRAENEG